MKTIKKVILMSVTIMVALCMFSACASVKEKALLPLEISQDDWSGSKKFVNLSTGIKMAYVEMGNPNGEVVVLQHGMTDNSRSWSLAAPYFAKAGYHVYLPDLRGMGKTDGPEGFYTAITYATDMKAFFDAMAIKNATVIGHSLGSYTVQAFALMFPERCNKVVLVSSIPIKNYQNEGLIRVYHQYVEGLKEDEHPSDEFMNFWYECSFKEDNAKEIEFDKFLANLKKEAQVLPKENWKNIIMGMAATYFGDLYSEFDKDIPVLVLHGDDDYMAKNENQEELLALFNVPETSFRNYKNVGHNIQFEITKQSSEDILYWMQHGKLPN